MPSKRKHLGQVGGGPIVTSAEAEGAKMESPKSPSNINGPAKAQKKKKPKRKSASEGKNAASARADVTPILGENTYWLTRIVFVRMVCFLYFVAFLVAYNQNEALISSKGLLPAPLYLERVKNYHTTNYLWENPTIFWHDSSDWALQSAAVLGIVLSFSGFFFGFTPAPVMFLLWVLYTSLDNIGQLFYGYGWEMQLLETGFLAMFLCPLWSWDSLPRHTPPSVLIILLCRWLIFRIMLGAGLIKIRSADTCWVDLRCMDYHYETQPIPNPLSWYFHYNPRWFHTFEVGVNHFVELVAPWFIFAPWRPVRNFAGAIQIGFQGILILSGNLSFLNWLTICPAITCLDDRFLSTFLSPFLSKSFKRRLASVQALHSQGHKAKPQQGKKHPPNRSIKRTVRWLGKYLRLLVTIAFVLLVGYLSIGPVSNLISPQQAMNRSFDNLKLVNTYGAFGSVGKVRPELIIKGTSDSHIGPNTVWLEYEFKCKPGNVSRAPCVIAPYQSRIDWQIWFAAMQSYENNPWLVHFVYKLLHNDAKSLRLIESSPFPKDSPPKWIKIDRYLYKFTTSLDSKDWWTREFRGEYLGPLNRDHEGLRGFVRNNFGY